MENLRTIKKIVKGKNTQDGAGVQLVRVFSKNETTDFDPFLLLDAFDSTDPEDYVKGFPWHPHRGIETITYLIQGDVEHGDSLGNKGSILDGDCQWMTAGSGIIHQEMPKESKRMLGAQLWLNLPAKDKMTTPAYGDICQKDVPVVKEEGGKIHIISGTYQNTGGAFEPKYVPATYLDVALDPNQEWSLKCEKDHTLFIYIFQGKAIFDPTKNIDEPNDLVDEKQAVLFNKGDTFWIKSGHEGIRFLLLSAPPLNEPIAWGGPIVMNTHQQLKQAFEQLDNKSFIKENSL